MLSNFNYPQLLQVIAYWYYIQHSSFIKDLFITCIWIQHSHFVTVMLLLFLFHSLRPINNLSVIKGRVFLGWTTKLGLMFLLKDTTQWRHRGSNPWPLGLELSSLHWAIALPKSVVAFKISYHGILQKNYRKMTINCFCLVFCLFCFVALHP